MLLTRPFHPPKRTSCKDSDTPACTPPRQSKARASSEAEPAAHEGIAGCYAHHVVRRHRHTMHAQSKHCSSHIPAPCSDTHDATCHKSHDLRTMGVLPMTEVRSSKMRLGPTGAFAASLFGLSTSTVDCAPRRRDCLLARMPTPAGRNAHAGTRGAEVVRGVALPQVAAPFMPQLCMCTSSTRLQFLKRAAPGPTARCDGAMQEQGKGFCWTLLRRRRLVQVCRFVHQFSVPRIQFLHCVASICALTRACRQSWRPGGLRIRSRREGAMHRRHQEGSSALCSQPRRHVL